MTIQGNFDPYHSRVSAGLPRPPPVSRQTHITSEEAEQIYRKIQEYENRKKCSTLLVDQLCLTVSYRRVRINHSFRFPLQPHVQPRNICPQCPEHFLWYTFLNTGKFD